MITLLESFRNIDLNDESRKYLEVLRERLSSCIIILIVSGKLMMLYTVFSVDYSVCWERNS